jgi:hypothetical protein
MAKALLHVTLCAAMLATTGCMMVDKVSDPAGYENGTYKPTFRWYPEYLFSRDAREYGRWWREHPEAMQKMRDQDAHPVDCECCSPKTAEAPDDTIRR